MTAEGKIMNSYQTSKIGNNKIDDQNLSLTSTYMMKALAGDFPLAALEKLELDKNEVSLLLARELMFWSSVVRGAKMHVLGLFLDELHHVLLKQKAA
jgi:hypothetical protein